jgi:hypothetical protein
MKTEYKYIHFLLSGQKTKTNVYSVLNNKSNGLLGTIQWHPAWRQYCFYTEGYDCVFSDGCLADIIDFIKQLKGTL